MKKIIVILITVLIGLSGDCFGQGKVTRPSKQQSQTSSQPSQTSKQTKSKTKVTVSEPDGYINGHGYVDLGLPSGIKWATTNLGANSPSEYGDYYAWGETSPKSSYPGDNSKTYRFTKDELKSSGIINSKMFLSKDFDAAHENWKDTWHIPTYNDFKELLDECIWQSSKVGGSFGYIITGPNGHSLFIPSAGYIFGEIFEKKNEMFRYWSSTPSSGDKSAEGMTGIMNSLEIERLPRFYGLPIRPVSE